MNIYDIVLSEKKKNLSTPKKSNSTAKRYDNLRSNILEEITKKSQIYKKERDTD